MKNSIITLLLISFVLYSCGEDKEPIIIQPLDSSSKTLQVAIYSSPDVYTEGYNHNTQQVEQIKLDYNRQVFVDLDAASSTSNADTLAVHYNDSEYVKFDVWDEENDHAQGLDGWDIALAPYNGRVDVGTGELVEYSVTGALINKGVVSAIRINKEELEADNGTFVAYEDITYKIASEISLSEEVDAIGHDWKSFSFATYTFEIVEYQYYIIKSTEGELFKLAFTSFYSEDLDKGYPKFMFQRIVDEE